jgi:hypothetical protein
MPRDFDDRGGFPPELGGWNVVISVVLVALGSFVWQNFGSWWSSFYDLVSSNSGRLIVTVAVFGVGSFLYWVRQNHTVKYAIFELFIGLVTAFGTTAQIKTYADIGSWLGLSAAAYLIVRGWDNFFKGRQKHKDALAKTKSK